MKLTAAVSCETGISTKSGNFERYVDTRVRRFFEGDTPFSWREFQGLSPEVMHDLSTYLHPVQRSKVSWFKHDQNLLLRLTRWLGGECSEDMGQPHFREFMARRLFVEDSELKAWLRQCYPDVNPLTGDSALRTINVLIGWRVPCKRYLVGGI